jgi:hypothetical protein
LCGDSNLDNSSKYSKLWRIDSPVRSISISIYRHINKQIDIDRCLWQILNLVIRHTHFDCLLINKWPIDVSRIHWSITKYKVLHDIVSSRPVTRMKQN